MSSTTTKFLGTEPAAAASNTLSTSTTLTNTLNIQNIGPGENIYVGSIRVGNVFNITLRTIMAGANITIDDYQGALRINAPAGGGGTATVSPIVMSGDVVGTGYPTIAATLAASGVTAGTYSYATLIVDAKGRVTNAASHQPVTSIITGTGLTGGTITTTGTLALANTSVTAGTYTVSTIVVDAQGRLTSASSGSATVGPVNTFATLTDGPGSIAANRVVIGNGAGSALAFFPGELVQEFAFTVTFTGTYPTSFSNVPAGWTITTPSSGVIAVRHNLGKQPVHAFVWGLTTVANTWTQRSFGGAALNLSYVDTDNSTVYLNGFTTSNTAATGLLANVSLFFTLT